MDINATLADIKSAIESVLPDIDVEIFSRDISQYKYLSQSPIGLVTLRGTDFSAPPHRAIRSQKASVELTFFYLTRSVDDKSIEGLSAFVDAISSLEGVTLDYLRSLSHKKDVSIFEIKAYKDELL